ncbi:sigma-70 family RNA polymerase sigma factor [candidate division KSB1 bacterium]|nr:sigma-70 family RNA polymerase sigma factor [candidate division KSB1 bacterium]NIV69633.1 sigma-70 family RNA polymerase sigma factor [Phycisphaerae bacterium]NIR70372.1 sigma-70 family RNA polymerase sigma factor [candidate division KSB1 bacterium]NIS24496.1 sigma-70 family RNA polymerase sigma factor [candidate division KSB1 bacterium]NIT71424.1 sigma-70 family RNA polymerase sigma factor [candidate division KSB1 bacterium]
MIQKIFIGPAAENKYQLLKQFEALALPLFDRLYSTAIRMTRHSQDAEDLVQDTYLKAWRYFHRFEPGSNFAGWIFRILINNFINEYRKKKNMHARADFDTATKTFAAKTTVPINEETSDYHKTFDDAITAALEQLPEHYRAVILLSDVNDLKYKEIAEALNCPIGTVMSRLNRGRQMLAKSLKKYAVENGYVVDSDELI